MAKSKLELIKDYIATCPLLSGGKIRLDYLEDEIDSYSIDKTPSNPIYKQYKDGGCLKQITFDFVATAPYSALENLANSSFFEEFSEWIETNNRKGILPNIDDVQWIKCTSPDYVLQKVKTVAMYIIQMQLVYKEEN